MSVDITYDLVDPDNQGAYILVECSSDGGISYGVPIYSLTGDAGVLVPPGNGKHIVWNAFNDWANNYTTNAKIRLTADASFKGVLLTTTNTPPATNLLWIPSGSFAMDAGPNVYISRGFWMGRFEVTQGEFVALMTNNPSAFTGSSNRPVDTVSWDDAVLYCQRLNSSEQSAGRLPVGWSYRLPTEAEWEYAARAGTTTPFYFGDVNAYLREPFFAWYDSNSGNISHDVGGRAPNRWGLYDMYGNVWEWCSDWFNESQYPPSTPSGNATDPQGPLTGSKKLVRGGSYSSSKPVSGRQTYPYIGYSAGSPDSGFAGSGFRVVLAQNP